MATKTIKLDTVTQRLSLIIIGLICLLFVFFATKWFWGNAIANGVVENEVAQFAISLAPNDPQTHISSANIFANSFLPDDMSKSLAEYEKAVALSPNDYLLWVALGKAKERNGDSEGAEKALLKAVELAPNYANVQWIYGNILLRKDKTTEAFSAIRKAVEGDAKYANPATSTAWDIFNGDIDAVRKAIGDSDSVKSSLSIFLAEKKRFDEAMEIWNNLPLEAKARDFRENSDKLFNLLITEKKYRSALQIKSQIAEANGKRFSIGQVTDGSFEGIINPDNVDNFEWQIAKGNKPKIGVNEQKYKGEKSLAIVFDSPLGKDFRTVSQTVAVESNRSYEFRVFYKSGLESSATVKWEIKDISSGEVLASTDSVSKSNEWKSLSAKFTTKSDSEGIVVSLIRETCTSADCSISGTVWFDDISLN